MNREAQIGIAVVAVLLVVLVVAGLGLAGTTTTTTSQGSGSAMPNPPSDGSAGVVFDLRSTGGFSLFGMQIVAPDRVAHVGLIVPLECVRQDSAGVEELLTEGVCADLPVHGELSGGGTTAAGQRIVFITVNVSERCFEALSIGDPWPSGTRPCAAN